MYGLHQQWLLNAVDTKEMADQWKRELENVEERVEDAAGACRLSVKAKLDWLFKRQKDQQ